MGRRDGVRGVKERETYAEETVERETEGFLFVGVDGKLHRSWSCAVHFNGDCFLSDFDRKAEKADHRLLTL